LFKGAIDSGQGVRVRLSVIQQSFEMLGQIGRGVGRHKESFSCAGRRYTVGRAASTLFFIFLPVASHGKMMTCGSIWDANQSKDGRHGMKTRIFNRLSAVSLALFIAVVILLMRSFYVQDALMRLRGTTQLMFTSDSENLGFHVLDSGWGGPAGWTWGTSKPDGGRYPSLGFWRALGFGHLDEIRHPRGMPALRMRDWWLPHWFVAALAAVLPVGWTWCRLYAGGKVKTDGQESEPQRPMVEMPRSASQRSPF